MIRIIIFILMTAGGYSIICELTGLPPGSTGKGIRCALRKEKTLYDALNSYFILPFVKVISPFIKIAEYKNKRMVVQLARAGIDFTPQEYFARSILMSGTAFVLSFLLLSVTMQNMKYIAVVLAVVVFFHFHGEIKDRLKIKDRLIEAELPKFIRAIVQGLRTEKDIIKLLETYQTISGDGLKYDIEVLIMDLKSGNFEDGMTEFDKRVGNAYVSRLTKALIATNRGDNQDSSLNYLISDMGTLAKEMMQRELNKRPGRVKMLVIPVVLVAVVALFYVIGMNLFTSLSGIM